MGPGRNRTIHLVFRVAVSFEDMSRFARSCGWRINQQSVRAAWTDESPEFLWHVDDGQTVRLVRSSTLGYCYLVLVGDEPGNVAALVRDAFPIFPEMEILARLSAARSPDDRIASLHLTAAAAIPTYNPTIHEAVQACLQDSDQLVALAALAAAFHLRWRQLKPLVQRLSTSPTTAENVRVVASNLLGLARWDRGATP